MQGQVDLHYVQSLGLELATIDKPVYDGLITVIRQIVGDMMPDGGAFGDCPVLISATDAPDNFRKVQGTLFYSVCRNFMGELNYILFLWQLEWQLDCHFCHCLVMSIGFWVTIY